MYIMYIYRYIHLYVPCCVCMCVGADTCSFFLSISLSLYPVFRVPCTPRILCDLYICNHKINRLIFASSNIYVCCI